MTLTPRRRDLSLTAQGLALALLLAIQVAIITTSTEPRGSTDPSFLDLYVAECRCIYVDGNSNDWGVLSWYQFVCFKRVLAAIWLTLALAS